jgi:hypothetical protein
MHDVVGQLKKICADVNVNVLAQALKALTVLAKVAHKPLTTLVTPTILNTCKSQSSCNAA